VTTLLDLCSLIRSKNAGPFVLTFDFMCRDQQSYRTLRASGLLTPQLFADLYGADPDQVLVVHHDRAQAVKVSLPRPVRQGDIHDSDSYGGQQYAPLVDLEVPVHPLPMYTMLTSPYEENADRVDSGEAPPPPR
jgi:hypothetical protein